MKRVYIQIIDPINGTCVNACHEYPDEYNQAVEATLRYYNLSADEVQLLNELCKEKVLMSLVII